MEDKCDNDYEKKDEQENYAENNENYVFKAKICKRLSREFGLDEIKYDEMGDYDVPKEHGLTNCDIIIPSYYQLHKHPSKIFDLDYFTMIKDDIRNFRVLNEFQLKYIKELSDEHKNELFDIYNNCVKSFNNTLEL